VLANTTYADPPPIKRVEEEGSTTRFHFYLDPSSPVFIDHFPTYELIPGVMQVHWVVLLMKRTMPDFQPLNFRRLKFTRPMRPNADYVLEVEQTSAGRMQFLYTTPSSSTTIFSSGTIEFAA
jgi:3-hydroxymyristoyl/3-hydroxydecanoyl-(acyl carrier protein) dehydratase